MNPNPSKPNVLLIVSDQHHAGVMHCAGDRFAQTPNLDTLASTGLRATSAYCNFPLCGPSRMSFMTSRYPTRIRCLTNTSILASDIPTFAHAFGAAGYDTILSGRMHFVGSDQRHGYHQRLISDVPPTAYLNNGWQLEQILGELRPTAGPTVQAITHSGPGHTGYQAYDQAVTDATVHWLHQRSQHQSPDRRAFMLTVGYVLPHPPFVAPPADYAHYDTRITTADLPPAAPDKLHELHRAIHARAGLDADLPDEDARRARVAYYAMCTFLDRLIGKILATLRDTGLADNTIIVYSSDHGEQLGEHGCWWKSTFYEASARVPLIVAWPNHLPQGKTIDRNLSLLDLGPTLLDLVGAQPLPGADGRSFRRLLQGDSTAWPDQVIAENITHDHHGKPVFQRMVRRGRWKLNHYFNNSAQLFDLQDDPHEQHDRATDPANRDILNTLTAQARAGVDAQAVLDQLADEQQRNHLIARWRHDVRPPEPDPPWFANRPPRNWWRDAAGLHGNPPEQ